MKRNFNQNLHDLEGNIIYSDKDSKVTVTMKRIICDALLFPNYAGEERLDGFEKVKRFNLAVAVSQAENEIKLTTEDQALIKEMVGKFASPLVVGQIFNYIEETEKPKKKDK